MKKGQKIGIIIFIIIAIIGGILLFVLDNENKDDTSCRNGIKLKGYIGGEKKGFLENEKVKKILCKNYEIELNWDKAGSIEMVEGKLDPNVDFLWPSSQVALEIYKNREGKLVSSDIIFSSPIVIYTWDSVMKALIKEGLVEKKNEIYGNLDLSRLINDYIIKNKRWEDIGFDKLGSKKIEVFSTDPTKSNSGFMFSGLVANIINNEDIVNNHTLEKVKPQVKKFFAQLGFLEHSSGTLFQKYTERGFDAFPLVVGYESQIIELASSVENKDSWNALKGKIKILYPEPTVWSSHPLIVVDKGNQTKKKAKELKDALQSKELLQIAWNNHGFRSSAGITITNVKAMEDLGLPKNITKIINMPNPYVMNELKNALKMNANSLANDSAEGSLK